MCGQKKNHHMKCDMLRSLFITWVVGGGGCRCTAKLGVSHRFVTSLSRSFRRVPINRVILDGQWFNKNPRTQQLEGSKGVHVPQERCFRTTFECGKSGTLVQIIGAETVLFKTT